MKPTEEQQTITGEQVEQSLEEKVREILDKTKGYDSFQLKQANALGYVCIENPNHGLLVEFYPGQCGSQSKVWFDSIERGLQDIYTFEGFKNMHERPRIANRYHSWFWNDTNALCLDVIDAIESLLTAQPETEQTLEEAGPKPTYEELEAQLNKLKSDYQELDDEFEETHKRHCQARKAMEHYQAEFLDMRRDRDSLATNYQRQAETLNSMRERLEKAEAEKKNFDRIIKAKDAAIRQQNENISALEGSVNKPNAKLVEERDRLQEQLQNCMSEEDHEREIDEWVRAFQSVCRKRDKYEKRARKYRKWFHREYAKNAEDSQ